ncbi:MAG: prepilin-type N-terminal cleavage/methylation domain-containing protein [Gammaproteobacteria bacterium]
MKLYKTTHVQDSKTVYKSANQLGLTLIELLISLVIISIVVTLCANGFTFGSRVWAKVDDHQGMLDEIASAQRFMRKVLSEAVFYPIEEDQKINRYFNGEPEKMIFLAPSPQYGLDDYLYNYEIYKQKENGAYNLSLRYLPANTYFSGKTRAADRDVKLIKNAKNIKFGYYGLNQRTDAMGWYSNWLNQSALPSRVSITVESFDGKTAWPPLIVETKFGGYILP